MKGIELPSPLAPGYSPARQESHGAWQLAPDDALADTLFERVTENAENDANEIMWGSPGTMLAAHAISEWTATSAGRMRGARAPKSSAATRGGRALDDPPLRRAYRGLGPPHGLVGNVLALRQRLPRTQRGDAGAGTAAALAHGRRRGRARQLVETRGTGSGLRSSRDRHSAADYLDEELLLAGAELVWQAGPHGDEKGYGICHGTAGNGYELLKTFARTGDER